MTWVNFLEETLDLPTMLSSVPTFWEKGFLEVITGLLLILNPFKVRREERGR